MHALVAGWFSFEDMGTTAGDLMVRDIVCDWLAEAGLTYDVALAGPWKGNSGVDWQQVEAENYQYVVFVCGPFGNGWPLTAFLRAFSQVKLIGVNLSLLESLDTWNPFHLLFERDSAVASHPDISFYGTQPDLPVVGIILVHKQKEYGNRALHEEVEAVLHDFLNGQHAALVPIDTVIPHNKGGLRTPAEVETLIKKMDVVLTTRLHGTVLAIKNGIPVIPIDPIAGGAKITRQVKAIGWPLLFQAESVEPCGLAAAYHYCLTEEARLQAQACAQAAFAQVDRIHRHFVEQLQVSAGGYRG